jgi:hypothetical protein
VSAAAEAKRAISLVARDVLYMSFRHGAPGKTMLCGACCMRIQRARDKVSLLGCRRSGALYMSSDKLRARKLTEHTAYRSGDEVALCPPRPRLWPCSAEGCTGRRRSGTAPFRRVFFAGRYPSSWTFVAASPISSL